ncbi:hypothetical protein Mkiyose1665_53910 [Mycobacterium kiyosense]|uniref:GAF domain-containing protein n=1 Tax=Mycobacterium kiyosense TaxID=2871094 RepID=A0A9P3Q2U9_9MYCO|nr:MULTISPECIES: GAF domain-containing protein [Mycobacterium]BDB42371.1 hypothetical protein IWGMT90018_28170 [Mycobacterium kiyosense]BDE14359.1 hypothetical protein MKCMC460_32190 [Mycobacterium sp. 20KCMC460]GLB83298.1 hypothetical protein SRL2020028_25540 [Mycobacterium kiyosense]GLB98534.1 hypothetical protein SRL2020226_53100 [Mycobacterium kiyosense]GLC03149.1 hypothetical protein SRL2020400_37400 [Mycobacterium kiyosense]
MSDAQIRLAIADLTATLTTDFDLPVLLDTVASDARQGFDAYAAVVVLLDHRRTAQDGDVHVVAQALREPTSADLSFQRAGPGADSARRGAVTMINDLGEQTDTRWERYRRHAAAAGMRGMRAFPMTSLGVPLGALVIHTDIPWGSLRPNDFGQTLANLTALALSIGPIKDRATDTTATINTVLQGSVLIATATGIIAERLTLSADDARAHLARSARQHGHTTTTHARAVVVAHNNAPHDPTALDALLQPPDLISPPHIDL